MDNRGASIFVSFASAHAEEYRQTANQMGISLEGPDYLTHFNEVRASSDDSSVAELGMGQPKSDAERIFFAIASPEEIAAFEEKMQPFQAAIDEVSAAAAAELARDLQYNKDLKAANDQFVAAFSDLGIDDTTLDRPVLHRGAAANPSIL